MTVRLSFCTTCMGRLHHLQQTLPENLAVIERSQGVQIVLLDYSSPDGLNNWIRTHMLGALRSGLLVFYEHRSATHFHMSHAKNIAHRVAEGEIVCNLDADNYVKRDFIRRMLDVFDRRQNCFVRAQTDSGACGRIALRKRDFVRLGGYDERMQHGWGYEDRDFAARARSIGLAEILIPPRADLFPSIAHSSRERTAFSRISKPWDSRELHRHLSEEAIRHSRFVANTDRNWGAGCLTRNFNTKIDI